MVESCLRALLGGVLNQSVFREFQLPMRMKNGSPSFGMGLTSAVSTAAAAHLASASPTHKLCTSVTRTSGSLPTALSADQAAVDAHTRWTQQVDPIAVIPLTQLDRETPLSQNAMVAFVNEWTLAQLPSGDDRTKAFRAILSKPGVKTWLQCTPTPGMRTFIADRDFCIWMQYYCRISLFEAGTPYRRRECKHTMNHYGDHLLFCPNGSPRGWRHNSQVRLLVS